MIFVTKLYEILIQENKLYIIFQEFKLKFNHYI